VFGKEKESGILLALSSLPSNYGIGSLGFEAFKFVDFLRSAKQKYWQMLPLVPLGDCNSPYKSVSCFAGEILYIDLDFLVRDGLLLPSELPLGEFPKNTDFDLARKVKLPLIKKAADRFDEYNKDYDIFYADNSFWLDDFAIFMTAFEVYGTNSLVSLPDGIKYKIPKEMDFFKIKHQEKIRFYKVSQYFFYAQYFELKRYANDLGIKIIGDLPFYVSADSSDVWANPNNFLLDNNFKPKLVAGVPPDYFSKTGQLWGNPIYDFEYMRKNHFSWWTDRILHYLHLYDSIRIDHFRAFADYYTIPADSETAENGKWETGIGMDFWGDFIKNHKNADIIAEDLGVYSNALGDLLKNTGFPNIRVLQFAFSGDMQNPHLPQNFVENCICYTGTHDNNTTLGFIKNALPHEKYLMDNLSPETVELKPPYNLINLAMKSTAKRVIIPMQDWLGLDETNRMNVPGVANGNWSWRMEKDALTDELIEKILKITR